jgi:multidrug efflux pump subunit AcrA (membrane-fusion protein)
VRIPGSGRYKALLVPDAAIGNDQSHKTVLVINQANIVEPRIVQIGALFGHLRAIKSGLSENDKVIVNGQMKAFPGAPVTPTESSLQFDLSSITP